MTTKEYLGQIRRYDKLIQNKLSEIYQLKTLATSVTIPTDKENVQTSGNKDKLGGIVAKIVDLERETDELIDIFTDKRQEIIAQIDMICNHSIEEYDVLTARFVKCLDFKDIPDEVHMSERKVFYVYNTALQTFEKNYGDKYKSVQ